MAEQLYKSSPKTFNFMGRSTNHGDNLNTNPQSILPQLSRIRNLHLKRRKASATKSLVSSLNKINESKDMKMIL
jgi:hypothetical protein